MAPCWFVNDIFNKVCSLDSLLLPLYWRAWAARTLRPVSPEGSMCSKQASSFYFYACFTFSVVGWLCFSFHPFLFQRQGPPGLPRRAWRRETARRRQSLTAPRVKPKVLFSFRPLGQPFLSSRGSHHRHRHHHHHYRGLCGPQPAAPARLTQPARSPHPRPCWPPAGRHSAPRCAGRRLPASPPSTAPPRAPEVPESPW